MKGNILDRAIRITTGKRLTARGDRMVQMKVKRMAADKIIADRQGRPSDALMGAHVQTYNYGGGIVVADEHVNGVLLQIKGRKQPEWFFKPRLDDAHQKARLIRDYVIAIGKWEVPSEEELEIASGRAFDVAAKRIKPDAKRLPSDAIKGYLIKNYTYAGGIKLSEYTKGVAIHDGDKVEWFGASRKRDGFDKAKYLSDARKTKQIFA